MAGADRTAHHLILSIKAVRKEGITGHVSLARALTTRGVPTAQGLAVGQQAVKPDPRQQQRLAVALAFLVIEAATVTEAAKRVGYCADDAGSTFSIR